MELNNVRSNYYYAGIDSWIILALYGHALNKKEHLTTIKQKYNTEKASNEYLSIGGAVSNGLKLRESNIQFLTKSVNTYFKHLQNSNLDLDFVEVGIRFLFERETLMLFTNIGHRYRPNVTPLSAPLKYNLLLEDLFIEQELTGDEVVRRLFGMNNRYIPRYNVATRCIKAITGDISTVVDDAKLFISTFNDIYENGIDVDTFHYIRKLIYNANNQALENLGIIEQRKKREKDKLIREKKKKQESEKRKKVIERCKEDILKQIELYNIRQELELKQLAEAYILNRPSNYYQNNICIKSIIDCMWIYNMIEKGEMPIPYCAYITGWEQEVIIRAYKLADIRYKAAIDVQKSPINLVPGLQIDWNMAIVADYSILVALHNADVLLDYFKNANDETLRAISEITNIPVYIMKDQQNILNCWCHSDFTDSFANLIKNVAEASKPKTIPITNKEIQAEYKRIKEGDAKI